MEFVIATSITRASGDRFVLRGKANTIFIEGPHTNRDVIVLRRAERR